MSPTAFKRAVLPVLVVGGGLLVWQASKESPPAAVSSSPSSHPAPSAESPLAAAPAGAAETAKPAEMAQSTETTPQATASNAAPQSSPPRETDKPPVAATPGNAPPLHHAEAMRVQQDVGSLKFLLRDFRNALGGNPVGSNAEIIKALLGRNPKKLALKLWDGHRVNAEGELIDPWGSPYFFHQISGQEMEILCAGPDRILWNKDDLNLR